MSSNLRHRRAYNEIGHAHALTFGCFHGYPFLVKERPCEWLAESIQAACSELQCSLWAYVFMPNHVHLIVHFQRCEPEVALLLKQIKNPVARRALAVLRSESPEWLERVKLQRGKRTEYHFWQRGGGYDRNITEPKTLVRMIEYLHLNPVRKGLVEVAADWKWSSAGWFAGREVNPLRPDQIPHDWAVHMSSG